MVAKLILGIGGTTRAGSSSELLVRAALSACEQRGVETVMFGAAELSELPFYAPENPERTPQERAFVADVRRASGFIIGTPGYHAGMSALVKNAVDLIQDTVEDERVYFDKCPVGLVVSAAGWQATGITLSAMRDMVCALRGWPTPVAITANSRQQKLFDTDSNLINPDIGNAIEAMADQLVGFSHS